MLSLFNFFHYDTSSCCRFDIVALAAVLFGITTSGHQAFAAQYEYVDDTLCADCHQEQYRQWLGSHHDWAMRSAGEGTVKGDFNDAEHTHFGVATRFFRRGDQFIVNTEGPDGKHQDYEIKYTFGIEPLQQYLIEFPGGRLQSLTTAWDTRPSAQGGQRWFALYPDERIEAGDPLHWTGPYQNWNGMCAECHSTHLQKNYDPASDSYQTRWSAVNVGCQACHGPGSAHITLAKASGDIKLFYSGLPVDFTVDNAHYEIDQCGRCHSRRRAVSPDNYIGKPLLDSYMPALLEPGLYYPDGQIFDEVYVYGSFLQSRMYQAGVRCSDCHNSHTARLRADGNAVCTQCHSTAANTRFPSLQSKTYDGASHHFHEPGTPGAQCVNCHAPARTYMVVDPRRDHSFRIPRPDLSDNLGTPNACTGCHEDQTAAWATQQITTWYGGQRRPHYGEMLAAGRGGETDKLVMLATDPQYTAIVRATALSLLPASGPEALRVLRAGVQTPEPLQRYGALRSLSQLPPNERFESLARLLDDPLRALRSEAARALNAVPPERFEENQRTAFDTALADYRAAQLSLTDIMPGAHLNLGVLEAERNQTDAAEVYYLAALKMDPDFLPARFNLATLYNATGRNRDAERMLREGTARMPDEGELHYSLGLLLAEEQRLEQAVQALGEAARLLPERLRVHYNYGLALQHAGRIREAETAFGKAYRLNRNDPDVLQALIILYAQQRLWDKAYPYAEHLVRLYPDAPGPRRMLEEISTLRQK